MGLVVSIGWYLLIPISINILTTNKKVKQVKLLQTLLNALSLKIGRILRENKTIKGFRFEKI